MPLALHCNTKTRSDHCCGFFQVLCRSVGILPRKSMPEGRSLMQTVCKSGTVGCRPQASHCPPPGQFKASLRDWMSCNGGAEMTLFVLVPCPAQCSLSMCACVCVCACCYNEVGTVSSSRFSWGPMIYCQLSCVKRSSVGLAKRADGTNTDLSCPVFSSFHSRCLGSIHIRCRFYLL